MELPRIRLLARADDAGSCRSANEAVREVLETGIARNASVMVPCAAFEDAARLLAPLPGACLGLHMTVTAEWDTPKWGPVLPPQRVPTLVDADGHFHPTAAVLHEHNADPDEILAEVEAQLARARDAGLAIAYFDQHMAFEWLPGVAERLAGLARREGLLRGRAARLPDVEGQFDDAAQKLIARLDAAAPGTYLVVGHPGHDDDEMRGLTHRGLEPGRVARERDADRRMFTDPRVLAYCHSHGVEPVRFTDVGSPSRGPA